MRTVVHAPLDLPEATAEARRIIEAANAAADRIIDAAQRRAQETYRDELDRSVQRLAETRDEYEMVSSRLRSLKEAMDAVLTAAVRDHREIRIALDKERSAAAGELDRGTRSSN